MKENDYPKDNITHISPVNCFSELDSQPEKRILPGLWKDLRTLIQAKILDVFGSIYRSERETLQGEN
jgi:hypothetical protein